MIATVKDSDWLRRFNAVVVDRDRYREIAEAARAYRRAVIREQDALSVSSAEALGFARRRLDRLLSDAGLPVEGDD
jgi:hypothetical protein